MDEAELDFSNPEVVFSDPAEHQSSCSMSMDSFFDEILKDSSSHHHHACTHTHTCNPPGPDLSHTHTCLHVHTKIVPAPTAAAADADADDHSAASPDKGPTSKKRPCGNREAVRKYREKKKARTASLEDEVVQLRQLNQQLIKRLQGQAALEAEVARLRCLLVDIRGRIEGEIGSFPYQKPVASQVNLMNSCDLRCDDQVYCLRPGEGGLVNGQICGACEIGNIQCMGSSTAASRDFLSCGSGNGMPLAGCSSNGDKIEGAPTSTEG